MAPKPPSNVKIYDRPERKGPPPLLIVMGLLIVLVVAYFVYKTLFAAPAVGKSTPGKIS